MNKTILIAAVIGIIAGGVGGFFVANKFQLSLGANESRAGLFIRQDALVCSEELNNFRQAERNFLANDHFNQINWNRMIIQLSRFDACIGY